MSTSTMTLLTGVGNRDERFYHETGYYTGWGDPYSWGGFENYSAPVQVRAGNGNDYVEVDAGRWLWGDYVWRWDSWSYYEIPALPQPATIFGQGGRDVIIGSETDDTIYGDMTWNDISNGGLPPGQAADADMINARDGNDVVFSSFGNDYVNGGTGDDLVYSGVGNDLVYGGFASDTVFGGDGDDQLWGGSTAILNTAWFGTISVDYDGVTDDPLGSPETYGSNSTEAGDIAHTDTSRDFLDGGVGNDSIHGQGGNDFLWGGSGNDYIDGGDGADNIDGGGENDIIYAGAGTDAVTGGDGADAISGQAGNDTIWGQGGNDAINGGDGADSLSGHDGNDVIYGDDPTGPGNNDSITGDNGADSLLGFGGNDTLWGGSGGDSIRGSVGNDTLRGEAGNDYLYGEAGADYFLYDARGFDGDLIFGFDDGLDKLVIHASIFANSATALAASYQSSGSTYINAGGGDVIAINSFTSLTADDFLFYA